MKQIWEAIKKYFFIMLFAVGIFFLPHLSFADNSVTITTPVIVTGYSGLTGRCSSGCTGQDYLYDGLILYKNGIAVSSSTPIINNGSGIEQPIGNTTTSVTFVAGDLLSVGDYGIINTTGATSTLINGIPLPEFGSTIIPPTINWFFPTDTTTTGLFSNWIFQGTNFSGYPWTIYVSYGTNSSTLADGHDQISTTNGNAIQFVPATVGAGITSTQTYYAQADVQDQNGQIQSYTPEISFTINNSLPFVENNSAHFIQPAPTSSAFCIAPTNELNVGSGIAFGLCSVAATFFGSNQAGYGFLGSEWSAFQATPPFNLVFGVASSVMQAASNGTSTQQNLSIGLPIGLTTSNVSILSSSTLTQLFVTAGNGHNIPSCDLDCAQAKTQTFMDDISRVVYAGTAVTTIAMIL